jgi:pre-mRNA 3'-end-processing factor FIP1
LFILLRYLSAFQNFAGMPEDQLSALPPEVRQMVMTGATTMMSAGPNPMMGPGVGMNPMMDMSGMGPMNMGPMGMGMNGDMQMQMQAGGPMMQDGPIPVPGGPAGSNGTPEQAVQMGMPDGFGPGGPGAAMMGMNMGSDFGMQVRVETTSMKPELLDITTHRIKIQCRYNKCIKAWKAT